VRNPHPFLVTTTGGQQGFENPNGDIRDHLADVDFWNSQIGWACGEGGVFKTADGGLTWQRMKPRGGWYHIRMSGPKEIWLLEGFWGQAKANLWRSIDDGQTWSEVLPGKLQSFSDLYCRGEERWVLCGDFQSYMSHDGGENWKLIQTNGILSGALHIAIPGDIPTNQKGGFVAYVLGHWGPQLRLVKSEDGGASWKEISLPASFASGPTWPNAVCFSDSMHGWIGNGEGAIAHTFDGGKTWSMEQLPTRQGICAMWFDLLGRGFVSVINDDINHPGKAVYMTLDSGASWIPVLEGHKQIYAFCSVGGKLWGVGKEPSNVPQDLVIIADTP
jgi:photosystem II stability/assembly factor-like uncharacterized protein